MSKKTSSIYKEEGFKSILFITGFSTRVKDNKGYMSVVNLKIILIYLMLFVFNDLLEMYNVQSLTVKLQGYLPFTLSISPIFWDMLPQV